VRRRRPASLGQRVLDAAWPAILPRKPLGRTIGEPRPGSVVKAISRMSPLRFGHSSGNSSSTQAVSVAQAIREVSCARRGVRPSVSCGGSCRPDRRRSPRRRMPRRVSWDQSEGDGTGSKGLRSSDTARFPICGERGFELSATTLIFLVIAVAAVFFNPTVRGWHLLPLGRCEQAARYSRIDSGRPLPARPDGARHLFRE
jgi:hypothetical protein